MNADDFEQWREDRLRRGTWLLIGHTIVLRLIPLSIYVRGGPKNSSPLPNYQ